MIEFHKVTKMYKTVIGVNDISLKIDGGVYGLLGPNGSGKTTFINLVMGQLRPTMGRLTVFGVDPWQNEKLKIRAYAFGDHNTKKHNSFKLIFFSGILQRKCFRTLTKITPNPALKVYLPSSVWLCAG